MNISLFMNEAHCVLLCVCVCLVCWCWCCPASQGLKHSLRLDDMMLPDNRLAGVGIEMNRVCSGEQHVQHVPSSSEFKNIPTCHFSLNIKRVSPPSHNVDIRKGAFGRLPGCMSQIPQILPYPHIVKGNRSWLIWHPSG